MMLNGDISAFSLCDILAFLAARGSSGRLSVTAGDRWGGFQLDRGSVEWVELEGVSFPAGERCINAALELLEIESGEFYLTPTTPGTGESSMAVAELLDRVEQRQIAWQTACSRLGSLDDPVRMSRALPSAQVIVTAEEWQILAAADGSNTPRQIATKDGGDPLSSLVTLGRLAESGMIVRLKRLPDDTMQAPAGAEAPHAGSVTGSELSDGVTLRKIVRQDDLSTSDGPRAS